MIHGVKPCITCSTSLLEKKKQIVPHMHGLDLIVHGMGKVRMVGVSPAKSLAALVGKVRLAVAEKFPIIPKGYSGLVQQLLVR